MVPGVDLRDNLDFLHVVTYFGPNGEYGGPFTVANNLCVATQKKGLKVKIICGASEEFGNNTDLNSTLSLFKVKPLFRKMQFSTMWGCRLFLNIYKEINRAKIVHIHFARDLIPLWAALLCMLKQKYFILQLHGMIAPTDHKMKYFLDKLIISKMLKKADLVLCLTLNESNGLRRYNLNNVEILENGIEVKHLGFPNLSKGPIRVSFISRIEKRKNLKTFVDVAKLSEQNNLDYKFEIYGPDEGDLEKNLMLIAEYNLKNIDYKAAIPVNKVKQVLSETDILILPSFNEPWAMVVLEALSVGTRVIVYPSMGIAEKISARYPNFVSNYENANSVFERLVSMNTHTTKQMRDQIMEFCDTTFGISAVAEKYFAIIKNSKERNAHHKI